MPGPPAGGPVCGAAVGLRDPEAREPPCTTPPSPGAPASLAPRRYVCLTGGLTALQVKVTCVRGCLCSWRAGAPTLTSVGPLATVKPTESLKPIVTEAQVGEGKRCIPVVSKIFPPTHL